ncbi:leukocyte immunoglobulin-like receptor subfamily A member 2 [Arvicanthis niloticus]|uniref:leukocyte immunoglobulin-like receptor subfamily A member 2 n=1 Tax=Arvicanthis niloticus TaxID=61156 RepID=UPI00148616F1|nr:platelet glycoprotein VI-like [Arvicanthis niloticus]
MSLGTVLLGFVCLMEQRIWAHSEPSPQPSIWADPGTMISEGTAVTIFCRTPPGVTKVRLRNSVHSRIWYDHTPQGDQEVFEFSLENTMNTNAGIYYCTYFNGYEWSQINDKLELIVTGVYKEKPSLTVDSQDSERSVTLGCYAPPSFENFILCRDGNASLPQDCLQQDHNKFLISSVSPGYKMTYRCFASVKNNSYLWSLPSDPLEIPIPGSYFVGHALENLIRLILAFLLLLGIVALLLDAWKSRRVLHEGFREPSAVNLYIHS